METRPSRMDGSNQRQLSQEHNKQTRPGKQELGSRNWEGIGRQDLGKLGTWKKWDQGKQELGKAELGKLELGKWESKVGNGKGKPEQGKQ